MASQQKQNSNSQSSLKATTGHEEAGALSKLGDGKPDGVGNASKGADLNSLGVSGASTGGYSGGSPGGATSDDIAAGSNRGATVEPVSAADDMGGGTGDGGVGGLGSGA